MGPHSWRVTGYSCPVGAAWEPLEAPAPGIRGGCWPAGCGTNPACSELSFDWAPKPRPGCRARGGLKTTQLKHRKHLGLNWGESGSSFKNPRRITKPLSKTKPKSLTTDHFVKKKKRQKISQTLLLVPPRNTSRLPKPGAWTPLHHPNALAWSPGRPLPTLRPRVGASLCHSAGARCPVPGAGGRRGGAEAPA